jgi:integrase
MTEIISKSNTRILTLRQYRKWREELNPIYKVIADVLLNTGMRVEEFWEWYLHDIKLKGTPGRMWYKPSLNIIHLPKGVVKKAKSLHQERQVILTETGCQAVEKLLSLEIRKVNRTSMREAFRLAAEKAGISSDFVTPKMLRKTLETWLLRCGFDAFRISSSIGHSQETMRTNYAGIQMPNEDLDEIREYLSGWGVVFGKRDAV